MDQSTIDCLILAATYLVFHVWAGVQIRKHHSKGVRHD